jgi:hypothetical protein
MGKVGGIILAGALIAGGVLLAGVTGGGSLVALAHGFGMAASGVGIGMLSRQLFGPRAMANRASEIRQTVANPLANLPVIYGTAKVGLRLVDIRTGTGIDVRKLYIVGAVCHGSHNGLPSGGLGGTDPGGIKAIKRIWFDEKLAFDASGTVQSAFKKGPTARAVVTKYLGTIQQAADPTLNAAFPSAWTSHHRGRGVAYLVFTLTLDTDIFQGIPNITVEVEGAQCLDPRESDLTYVWTTNPALQALDYLIAPIYGIDAGRRLGLASAAVSSSGVSNFSAANTVDGDPTTVAFHTSSATPGAYLQFDLGRAVELDRVDVYVELGGSPAQQFAVQYADAAGGSYTAVTASANPFNLVTDGRNTFRWPSHLTGAHRYWRLVLTNTPGSGPAITGVDLFETEVDYQSFADEANVCDQTVSEPPAESAFKVATGSTASNPLRLSIASHGWSTADRVHVALAPGFVSSGLTDASGPIEGRTYTITSVSSGVISLDGINASGTYVANSLRVGRLVSVPQYQANGVIDTGQEPQDNLRQILAAFRGRIIWQGGKFRCHSRKSTTASLQLTDADIRSIRWITPGTREKYNQARISFLNADRDWQPDERSWPPPGTVNTLLIADNRFPSPLDMDLPLVTSPYQASRLGEMTVRESRDGITVQAVVGARGMLTQVGDVVGLTYASAGWSAKAFSVEGVSFVPDSDLPVLTLVEYEPNAYVLSDTVLHTSSPNTDLPDATAMPDAPTSLVLTAGLALIGSGGRLLPRIKVEWTDATSPFIAYYEIKAKRDAEADYTVWAKALPTDELAYVEPVPTVDTWDIRVEAVTTLGIRSEPLDGSVTVSLTEVPVGIVEHWEDTGGARWFDSTTGVAPSQSVRAVGDSTLGGKVLSCQAATGTLQKQWTTKVPLNPDILYALRVRYRVLKEKASGDFSFGFICYDANGLAVGNLITVVSSVSPAASLDWQTYALYCKGWNGAWVAPSAGMVSNSGFGAFTAANVGDGSASGVAFESDAASPGSTITIDLGSGNAQIVSGIRLYLDAAGGVAQYKLQWSDDNSSWTDHQFATVGPGETTTWTPNKAGWNYAGTSFATGSSTAHRYWRLRLNNTPGAGPNVMELNLLCPTAVTISPSSDAYAPAPFPAGTAYAQPFVLFNEDDAELDWIELPPQSNPSALT